MSNPFVPPIPLTNHRSADGSIEADGPFVKPSPRLAESPAAMDALEILRKQREKLKLARAQRTARSLSMDTVFQPIDMTFDQHSLPKPVSRSSLFGIGNHVPPDDENQNGDQHSSNDEDSSDDSDDGTNHSRGQRAPSEPWWGKTLTSRLSKPNVVFDRLPGSATPADDENQVESDDSEPDTQTPPQVIVPLRRSVPRLPVDPIVPLEGRITECISPDRLHGLQRRVFDLINEVARPLVRETLDSVQRDETDFHKHCVRVASECSQRLGAIVRPKSQSTSAQTPTPPSPTLTPSPAPSASRSPTHGNPFVPDLGGDIDELSTIKFVALCSMFRPGKCGVHINSGCLWNVSDVCVTISLRKYDIGCVLEVFAVTV